MLGQGGRMETAGNGRFEGRAPFFSLDAIPSAMRTGVGRLQTKEPRQTVYDILRTSRRPAGNPVLVIMLVIAQRLAVDGWT